ncbi:thioredoxin [Glaciimonas immobilis]|uniref:Thioredoxin n=1 Tax=Glaciimonas immobilis TaxID=728004 RepID=A0A840RR45_9BURK|nr:thioredoxin [Glaciimonas immobilis]KAF3996837.1 thioredoxin [Glaciimonas immobilis]MBB5199612.1 thioredoxin 1 [Glaciimonas immobilis]
MSALPDLKADAVADFTSNTSGFSLIDFWAPWCGPCIAQTPTLDTLSSEFKGQVRMAKVNIDDAAELAQTHGIRGVPTLILFEDGKPVSQKVGLQSKSSLHAWLTDAVSQH